MINGDFHHKRGRLSPQQGEPERQPGEHRHQNTEQVQGKHDQSALLTEERGGKDGKNRQPRAAGHKRCHHDGHQPLPGRIQRPGPHDGRHVAAEANNQRHEGFSGQSQRLHHPVYHKRRPGHIAGVLNK
ncbi:hypothetical protein D3C81_1599900 [compost metagenome]